MDNKERVLALVDQFERAEVRTVNAQTRFEERLADEEWMSIMNKERDGLSPCCANISDLRGHVISMVGYYHPGTIYRS